VNLIDRRCTVADGDDDSWYGKYIEKLSELLLWLIKSGHRIAFCPTDTNDQAVVEEIVEKIAAASSPGELAGRIVQDPIRTTEALIERIQLCDVTIASRFHGVVLPFALHKPVLTMATYGRKIGDLMAQCGQARFHFMAGEADPEQLKRAFEALADDRHAIALHLERVVADFKARLERQYDEVFGPREQGRQAAPRPSETSVLDFRGADIHDSVGTASQNLGAGTACPE
jgi:polysaccharide pyruvyl transferase WcaK-like protein